MANSRVSWEEEEISFWTPNLAGIKEDWRPRVEIGDDFACDWGGQGGDFACADGGEGKDGIERRRKL